MNNIFYFKFVNKIVNIEKYPLNLLLNISTYRLPFFTTHYEPHFMDHNYV